MQYLHNLLFQQFIPFSCLWLLGGSWIQDEALFRGWTVDKYRKMDKGRHYRNRRHPDDGDIRTVASTPAFLPFHTSVHIGTILSLWAFIQPSRLKRHYRAGINGDMIILCVASFSVTKRKFCFAHGKHFLTFHLHLATAAECPASQKMLMLRGSVTSSFSLRWNWSFAILKTQRIQKVQRTIIVKI